MGRSGSADCGEGHEEGVFRLEEGERIGFCFPVHGWQVPGVVKRFLERVTIHGAAGHYAYALCTCGDSAGLAMEMMEGILRKKGIVLQSWQSLIMPESYVCLPFMYTDTKERETEKKAQAAIALERFKKVVVSRQAGYQLLVRGPLPWFFTHVVGGYFNRHMITDKKFTVDSDVCIHCGKCAAVCPVGDILFDEVPTWKNDSSCTCCLSCYHHCPVHAINYGEITRKRGQYYFK